jgi:hypothetical protein
VLTAVCGLSTEHAGATIALSDEERATLIFEARRAASWCTDRLFNAYPDDGEGADAQAAEIIEKVQVNLNAAALVINAAMSDESFEATPAMSEAVSVLRACVFRSSTVNGEWVVEEDDPGIRFDREHFDTLAVVRARVDAACAEHESDAG